MRACYHTLNYQTQYARVLLRECCQSLEATLTRLIITSRKTDTASDTSRYVNTSTDKDIVRFDKQYTEPTSQPANQPASQHIFLCLYMIDAFGMYVYTSVNTCLPYTEQSEAE